VIFLAQAQLGILCKQLACFVDAACAREHDAGQDERLRTGAARREASLDQ
jgi:hypothetical protein